MFKINKNTKISENELNRLYLEERIEELIFVDEKLNWNDNFIKILKNYV